MSLNFYYTKKCELITIFTNSIKKYLFLLLVLVIPTCSIYSQSTNFDSKLNYLKPDSLNLNFSFSKRELIGLNLTLANRLANLELINEDINFNSESYSDYYKNIYGIDPLQKDEIDKNLLIALEKTLPKEDEAIAEMRKYLGISQKLFAIILALIHLAKYN